MLWFLEEKLLVSHNGLKKLESDGRVGMVTNTRVHQLEEDI
jgi:hypothetical protein